MKRYQLITLLLMLGGLFFALTTRPPTQAATLNQNSNANPLRNQTRTDRPAIPKINGKTYGVARKLLIQNGWQPNKHEASYGRQVEVQSGNGPIFWNRGYRELVTCSGTGLAHCLFEFTDPSGRLLEVVTGGEEDEAGTYHARVTRVYLKKK